MCALRCPLYEVTQIGIVYHCFLSAGYSQTCVKQTVANKLMFFSFLSKIQNFIIGVPTGCFFGILSVRRKNGHQLYLMRDISQTRPILKLNTTIELLDT